MYPYHDEMWSLVLHADRYKAAMCFQIAHLWAWTYFFQRLGFEDMPFQYMFFSAVNVDHCFRKEVHHTQITPSNTQEVPFGESLNIWQLQDKLTAPEATQATP
jgi:DNA polymerase gamma 1